MLKKIVVGADHLGKELKDKIKDHLASKGIEVMDVGINDDSQVDYPDVGKTLAQKIQNNEFERGILVCGTGAGMAIVANKFSGVRAVCVNDAYTAERSIASNNAQIITFGALVTGIPNAIMYTDIWLNNNFQSERSGNKVEKINKLYN